MGYIVFSIIVAFIGFGTWFAGHKLAKQSDRDLAKIGRILAPAAAWGTPLLLAAITVWNMAYQVPAGHVGLVYQFGGIVGQRDDGLQWITPWQNLRTATVQVQGHKFEKLDSFSSETQNVFVAATVNVQVTPQYIQQLYREVGPNYFDVLVRPRVFQDFKDETVKYKSVDIAPNRENIRKAVRERLTKELQAHSITVQDLLLDNISFEKKFQDSIEQKQNETQLALAEEAKVAKERHKASQAIETARGEAEATLIKAMKQAEANDKLSRSITPQLVQYIFASKLAPNVNVMMVPAGQQFILGADTLKMDAPKANVATK